MGKKRRIKKENYRFSLALSAFPTGARDSEAQHDAGMWGRNCIQFSHFDSSRTRRRNGGEWDSDRSEHSDGVMNELTSGKWCDDTFPPTLSARSSRETRVDSTRALNHVNSLIILAQRAQCVCIMPPMPCKLNQQWKKNVRHPLEQKLEVAISEREVCIE